jgi:hypothetical protein
MTSPNKWLDPSHIRLMAGEITASEMRCVLAVIGPIVAELDAARLDAKRLDWLIASECQVWEYLGWFSVREVTEANTNMRGLGTGRSAIDAAIAQQKGET